jgi:cell wall-associated NlpC family hydrolase
MRIVEGAETPNTTQLTPFRAMPGPLFLDLFAWQRFRGIVFNWLGTPYKHTAIVRGRGADCAHFIAACWMEFGILHSVDAQGYYPKDWYACEGQPELVIEGMYRHLREHANPGYSIERFPALDAEKLMRGDVITFSTGVRGMSNHAAIYLGARDAQGRGRTMIHAMPFRGVTLFPFGQAFERRATNVFRVMFEGGC